MELAIVLVILALAATMVIPKRFYSFEPPIRELQHAVLELSDLALGGVSTRMRMETVDKADRGRVLIEALVRVEDQNDPKKFTLEWKPIKIRYPLTGDRWRLEPELIYFYTDGTCTPARILYADRDTRLSDADSMLLTVTGFVIEEKPERN